jgi:hypothetical protein
VRYEQYIVVASVYETSVKAEMATSTSA